MKFQLLAASAVIGVCVPLANAGVISPIGPFAGTASETWEGFLYYNENPNFYEVSPATIFGGRATITHDFMAVYGPPSTFGLGTSGTAQVFDGVKGMGLDRSEEFGAGPAIIDFSTPVTEFGAYWGAATGDGGDLGDPAVVTVSFFDTGGGLIDTITFDYSHSDTGDGGLDWQGWSSTTAIGSIVYFGNFVVIDGMQANQVPAPSALALLGIAGLAGRRRRRV